MDSSDLNGGFNATDDVLPRYTKKLAMERSDGWSKRRDGGSSTSRRSLSLTDSYVTPMESSPTDMSDTSAEIAVLVRSVVVSTSSLTSLSNEIARCIYEQIRDLAWFRFGFPISAVSHQERFFGGGER